MSKKALSSFITGDKSIEEGKIYTDEEVKDLDQSKFEDVVETPDPEAPAEEKPESVTPDIDSQE